MTNNPELIACGKTITIHSLQLKQPLINYTHHKGIVNSATSNHNNKVIASCGQDGKIFLVNAEKPENKLFENTFYAPKDKIYALNTCAFSPNSKYLAVGSVDSTIKLWDLRSDKNAQKEQQSAVIKSHHMGSVTSMIWIKNLKSQMTGTDKSERVDVLASSSSSGDIYVHSNKTGLFNEVLSLKLQEGINCIRASEREDFCKLAACTVGGTLAVWDLQKGSTKPAWTTTWNMERKPSLNSICVSPYTPILMVAASSDNSLIFYDINEQKSVKTLVTQQSLTCVSLHANGHNLVAGGMYGSLLVYDLRKPEKPINKLVGYESGIKSLQFFKPKDIKQMVPNEMKPKVNNYTMNPSIIQKDFPPTKSLQSENKMVNLQQIKKEIKLNEKMSTRQQLKEKFPENKLSATAQEVIRAANHINIIPKINPTANSHQVGSDFYRNRSKEPLRNDHLNGSLSQQGVKRQLREMKSLVLSVKEEQQSMKNHMYDMQERINLSLVKQFQLHQEDMRRMLQNLLKKDKEKEQMIMKLQMQNKRLRQN